MCQVKPVFILHIISAVSSDGIVCFYRGLGFADGRADGKDFMAGFGNEDFVFPLGREGAVFSYDLPAVIEYAQVSFPLVNHGFDSENHTRFENGALSFLSVMQDLRGFMEAASDTVAAEFLYN